MIRNVKGEDVKEELKMAHERMLMMVKPVNFSGSDGEEAKAILNFEDLCLVIGEQMGRDAKEMTVMEFYRAYDLIEKRMKRNEKGGKGVK
jgi:hypothetical protein